MTWLQAYLLTQAVEVPVYLYAGRSLPASLRWFLALAASTVTHPVVWYVFPWSTVPWWICFWGAESFAVVVEGAMGRALGLARPWLWALVANSASVLVGFGVQWGLR
ncbi:MAG: hypothetical protein JNJ70_25930 [Verrucomicrobiales bacterium]|nr:hypothetical protein [Verrucomicrobiales bacterium]